KPHHDLPFLLGDLRRLVRVARAIRVSGMAEDAVEHEPALRAELARDLEPVARGGIDAGPVIAAVHLEPDVQAAARQRLRRVQLIQNDAHGGARLADALHVRNAPTVTAE